MPIQHDDVFADAAEDEPYSLPLIAICLQALKLLRTADGPHEGPRHPARATDLEAFARHLVTLSRQLSAGERQILASLLRQALSGACANSSGRHRPPQR
jgi:hypothetical protein